MNSLVWRNIRKKVTCFEKDKYILWNCYGEVHEGEVLAIMGISGSGKSSLLNVLSGRSKNGVEGDVFMNGMRVMDDRFKRGIGYLEQEDSLLYSLTVEEQITFSAKLRSCTELSMIGTEINSSIDIMGLERVRRLPLYLISGGERKRVRICCELLSNPSVLLLDEATSGLDSAISLSLVNKLYEVAAEKRIAIILTIHQPSTYIFLSFPRMIFLSEGQIVYYGRPCDLMQYLDSNGFSLTTFQTSLHCASVNPCDFLIEILNSELKYGESKWWPRYSLIETFETNKVHDRTFNTIQELDDTNEFNEVAISEYREWLVEFWVLFLRSLVVSYRKSQVGKILIIESVIIGIFAGLCWFQLENLESNIFTFSAFSFFSISYVFFSSLFSGILEFLEERTVITRDINSGHYRTSTYYAAKSASSFLLHCVLLVVVYLLIAFPFIIVFSSASHFFESFLILLGVFVLIACLAESIGVLIGVCTVDIQLAIAIGTVVAILMLITGGFYVRSLPEFFDWIKYLSAFKYSYELAVYFTFRSWEFIECDYQGYYLPACYLRTTTRPLNAVEFILPNNDYLSLQERFVLLIGMIVGLKLIALIILHYNIIKSKL